MADKNKDKFAIEPTGMPNQEASDSVKKFNEFW